MDNTQATARDILFATRVVILKSNLIELRHRHNLTLEEMAEKCGMSTSTYRDLENINNEHEPCLKNIYWISQIFAISIDDLMGAFLPHE